jgi:hypothetical protein
VDRAPPGGLKKETSFLLFEWDAGGAWDGTRNDLDAEVGFEFSPEKNMSITALGRQVSGSYTQMNAGGRNLFEAANVTLWYVLPKEKKLKVNQSLEALALASVLVGPEDQLPALEARLAYNLKDLPTPIPVKAHEKYRITQTCSKDMKDKWFDGIAKATDVEYYSLIECVKILEGVHSDEPNKYPRHVDQMLQRAGMLNIRVESPEGCGMVLPDSLSLSSESSGQSPPHNVSSGSFIASFLSSSQWAGA